LPFGLWLAGVAAKLTVVVHGTDLNLLMQLPTWGIDRVLSPLARRQTTLRFVSAALKNQLLARPLSAPIKEMVVRAEVRPSLLHIDIKFSKEDVRKVLGVPPEQRLLLIVGRLITQKRAQVAIRAASLVPEAHIVVLGDGPLRAALERQFPHAVFLGQVRHDEALRWIQAADILLSASRWEGAPTVIREALALGTSVVSPAIADLPDWTLKETSLWLVE
jgi:glycosyltransferase involved in cell wall biosynthesis